VLALEGGDRTSESSSRLLRTQPITVAIFSQLRTFGSNIDIIAPATFVSLVIPLAVFFAFQRYFVQGLLAGSVK
jgi:alpha-glucoside transport system permease protein